jgi:ATP synthase protein I
MSASRPEDDFDRRRRELEARIAARRPEVMDDRASRTSGMAGMGYALRLSSEFIAGVVVGAVIGWLIDYAAGTSPWGLILFLLLGFGAGILNVLRSAGRVAERNPGTPPSGGPDGS